MAFTPSASAMKCPVCSAAFRSVETCPRCGTNLQPLMRIAARAWALRQVSHRNLLEGNLADALRCSAAARQLQSRAE